jgi:2-polyprenyl-3-methyl-5-hydroxy-6-metoxy-1,4-benzoquinol methylase
MLDDRIDSASGLYGQEYYASHCGTIPYARNDHWLRFFGGVADAIVRSFAPARVFDAGCAIGLLVECLWDRGVEAHGRDISDWAISQVRADVRPWCKVGSIAEPVGGDYDLITCIEVLEHIEEEDARRAIRAMAAAAPRILFSSTPTDLDEPTHVNVRPSAYWLALWAEAGFAPSVTHDAGYLAPHAYILERAEEGRSKRELVAFADRIRHRVALSQVGSAMFTAQSQLAATESQLADSEHARTAVAAALDEARIASADVRATLRTALDDLHRTHAALLEAQAAAAKEADNARRATVVGSQALDDLGFAQAETAALKASAEANSAAWHSETAAWRREIEAARHAAWIAQSERQAVLNSTTWRAAGRLKQVMTVVPRPLRRLMRRALKLLWWTVTFQLATRLRGGATRAELVASSPHFDPAWYLSTNADVGVSGIAPAMHYARFGAAEGRDPGPTFSTRLYLDRHPQAAATPGGVFFHAIAHGTAADGQTPAALSGAEASEAAGHGGGEAAIAQAPANAPEPDTVDTLFNARFLDLSALPVYAAPRGNGRRLTVVTDSIGGGSLYGGVGTALILAALAARRLNAGLRLVTRTEPADASPIADLLKISGAPWDGNIESVYAPRAGGLDGHDVPTSEDDLFLTTSWWTTWSTQQSVPRARIAYLVQEDERMFYPLGDDYLRCTETLAAPGLLRLVNSELLLAHFHDNGLMLDATAFEPSFPESLYYPATHAVRPPGAKRRFFFYARPHNARNLYWRGLEAIASAIEEGVLDPAEWEFYFAGHGGTGIRLPRGVRPIIPGPMAWADYAAFVRSMDVGLSLMYTPHPSYPPLDMAASGSVVVTNRFGQKRDLDRYSPNILCSDLDVPSLVAALREATGLAANAELRSARFARSGLQRDWTTSMAPALDRFVAWSET